jgi:hypothetical protein
MFSSVRVPSGDQTGHADRTLQKRYKELAFTLGMCIVAVG